MVNPDIEEYNRKYNKKTLEKISQYKLEDPNVSKYKIVVISNSQNSHSLGNFIEKASKYVGTHINIYFFTLKSINHTLGPVFIDEEEKIKYIANWICYYIQRDFYIDCNES